MKKFLSSFKNVMSASTSEDFTFEQEKESYQKDESRNNESFHAVFQNVSTFLSPPELANTDAVCQTIERANDAQWKEHSKTYFNREIETESARKAYLDNAKQQTYYVIGEKTITKKPFYQFNVKVPNPETSFPQTANVSLFSNEEAAIRGKSLKVDHDMTYGDPADDSYFAPKYFLFAVKSSNQKPLIAEDGCADVPQAHIKSKMLIK